MLTFAASMDGTADDIAFAQTSPDLLHYVEGFGRTGDVGVIMEERGAAWVRLAPPGPISTSKVWTHEVPELAIATVPEARGQGVGVQLLRALFAETSGTPIALSVRAANPAVRLYEREGFVRERTIVNRVGTASVVMLRRSSS